MPVSKKRKKRKIKSGPPLPKSEKPAKKHLTKQQILIYIISIAMILSLAVSFIVGSGSRRGILPSNPTPQSQTVEGNNEPPASETPLDQNTGTEGNATPTTEN